MLNERLIDIINRSGSKVAAKCVTTRSLVQSRRAIPAWSRLMASLSGHVLPPSQRE